MQEYLHKQQTQIEIERLLMKNILLSFVKELEICIEKMQELFQVKKFEIKSFYG